MIGYGIAACIGALVALLAGAFRERSQRLEHVAVDLHTFEAMIDALTRSKTYVLDCARDRMPPRRETEKVLKALQIALGEGNGHAPQALKPKQRSFF